MSDKAEIRDEELEMVSGGDITYTWNGTSGTAGLNGNNVFILVDKPAFVNYINEVHGTKTDAEILNHLLSEGVITTR